MVKNVLIINEDAVLCQEMVEILKNDDTQTFTAHSLNQGYQLFRSYEFLLIILDISFSWENSIDFLKRVRSKKPVPILVLSGRSDNDNIHKAELLRAGANAYLEKPYDMEECLTQAYSLLHLYMDLHPKCNRCYTLAVGGSLIIDPVSRQVWLNNNFLNLTRKEFDLLFCLASHAGQVLSREQLYQMAWNEDIAFNIDETVKTHIKSLRKKLTPAGRDYIKNVWGVGYRFSDEKDKE